MNCRILNVLVLFLAPILISGCKKEIEPKIDYPTDELALQKRSYFDLNSLEDDSVNYKELLSESELMGDFKVKSLTRYSLKIAASQGNESDAISQESLAKSFDLNNTYGIKIGAEPLRLFRFSNSRTEDDGLLFTNNLKWLSFPPKKNIKDTIAQIYKVDYKNNDLGKISICTIGDPNFYYQDAQEFRKSLDALFDGQLRFLGNSLDTNGYAFFDYGVYTHRHVVKAIKNIEKSDYYILFMGLNDYLSPFDTVEASLNQILLQLKSKNPQGLILLTTLPMVSKEAKDSRARNDFYRKFNELIRTFASKQNHENIKLIDLEDALKNDANYHKPNGVHLSQRGYTLYANLISKELGNNQALKHDYTGNVENFDSFPLSDQLHFSEDSNATTAGVFTLNRSVEHRFLTSQLLPSSQLKGPHRAEMTFQLEPYFNNNEIWLGIDFNVPSTYVVDSTNYGARSMILQIHSKPDVGESWDSYQKNLPFNRPSIGLYLVKTRDSLRVEMYYGLNGKADTKYQDLEWSLVGSSNIEPDKWNRFDLSIKLSHDNKGYIVAWLNKNNLTSFNGTDFKAYGPNMHNDALPYLKFGQYRYWADSNLHQVNFDNLKVKRTREDYFFPESSPLEYLSPATNLNP